MALAEGRAISNNDNTEKEFHMWILSGMKEQGGQDTSVYKP